jgi:hypothetical protein
VGRADLARKITPRISHLAQIPAPNSFSNLCEDRRHLLLLAEGRLRFLAEGPRRLLDEGHRRILAEGRRRLLAEGRRRLLVEGRRLLLAEGRRRLLDLAGRPPRPAPRLTRPATATASPATASPSMARARIAGIVQQVILVGRFESRHGQPRRSVRRRSTSWRRCSACGGRSSRRRRAGSRAGAP